MRSVRYAPDRGGKAEDREVLTGGLGEGETRMAAKKKCSSLSGPRVKEGVDEEASATVHAISTARYPADIAPLYKLGILNFLSFKQRLPRFRFSIVSASARNDKIINRGDPAYPEPDWEVAPTRCSIDFYL